MQPHVNQPNAAALRLVDAKQNLTRPFGAGDDRFPRNSFNPLALRFLTLREIRGGRDRDRVHQLARVGELTEPVTAAQLTGAAIEHRERGFLVPIGAGDEVAAVAQLVVGIAPGIGRIAALLRLVVVLRRRLGGASGKQDEKREATAAVS